MSVIDTEVSVDIVKIYAAWLERFGDVLERRAVGELVDLFDDESYWKDVLAFTGGYRTFGEKPDITRALEATIDATAPKGCGGRKAERRPAWYVGRQSGLLRRTLTSRPQSVRAPDSSACCTTRPTLTIPACGFC